MAMRLTIIIAACVLARASAAQQTDSSGIRTTLSGVFTADQAKRGGDMYASLCSGCHTLEDHTGRTFANSWAGKLLSELFELVRTTMPKSEPASLAPEEYAAVVSYLLKLNAMPEGAVELPADTVALSKIRIDGVKKEP